MTEQDDQPPGIFATATAPISEAAFLELQRIASESQERVQKYTIDANKEVALAQGAEQRRVIALNCALASFGVGHQSFNPPAAKPDTDDIVRRATRLDAFLRGEGQSEAAIVAIDTPAKPAE